MKKRLLISSALMTAVLACALGTGTYAWYSAGGAASINVTNASATISTANNDYQLGNVAISLSLTEVTKDADLVNSAGETWYYTTLTEKTQDKDNQKYGYLTLSASTTETDKAKVAAVAGRYTITITDECATNNVLYVISDSVLDAPTPYSSGEGSVTATLTVSSSGEITVDKTHVYYSVIAQEKAEEKVSVEIKATLDTTKLS